MVRKAGKPQPSGNLQHSTEIWNSNPFATAATVVMVPFLSSFDLSHATNRKQQDCYCSCMLSKNFEATCSLTVRHLGKTLAVRHFSCKSQYFPWSPLGASNFNGRIWRASSLVRRAQRLIQSVYLFITWEDGIIGMSTMWGKLDICLVCLKLRLNIPAR